MNHQSLNSIIGVINKNIIKSFLMILVFFIVIITCILVYYQSSEKKIISQKLNAAVSAFSAKISHNLIAVTTLDVFWDYLNYGPIGRKYKYDMLVSNIFNHADLKVISGMDIYRNSGRNIFHYGTKTDSFVEIDLCYINRKMLNLEFGNCLYKWRLYFNRNMVVEELKKLNPELVESNTNNLDIIFDGTFGDFPVAKAANMTVNLTINKDPTAALWSIILLIAGTLFILVVWNINRIKTIFKKYLSDPILEITAKIKGNQMLPKVEVEELAYLTTQIDQWKQQVIELERLTAQEEAKEEKVRMMRSIGASIAHELRTPLRSIISGVSGIQKNLPSLMEGYNKAKEAYLVKELIRPKQLELLQKVLGNLKAEGDSANNIIDMFLIKIKESISASSNIEKLHISECIEHALKRYAFQKSERDLISCDLACDFQFLGDKILVEHIIFNLIKNALYYISKVHKGNISINLVCGADNNELYFKDTGMGITQDVLPNIFNRFYSQTEGGVGIGLSFCKMAMEWMGGDIVCKSVEGGFTEFILYFPVIKG